MANHRHLTTAQAKRVVKRSRLSPGGLPFIAAALGLLVAGMTGPDVLQYPELSWTFGATLGASSLLALWGWFSLRTLDLQPEALRVLGRNS